MITFNGNSSDFSQRKLGSPTIDVLFNGNVVNYTIKIGSGTSCIVIALQQRCIHAERYILIVVNSIALGEICSNYL